MSVTGAQDNNEPQIAASQRGRILVVDDDQGVIETFAGTLRIAGYEVRTASNAHDALREAESFRPQAIIVDFRMPLVNGVGFLYRLRERPFVQSTPVLLMTGDSTLDDAVIEELHELGAEVRFKPIWIEDLLVLTGRLLERGDPTPAR